MKGRGQDRSKVVRLADPTGDGESLPYCIELWKSGHGTVERVLARASQADLARAIFKAARDEYPERRITLRRGNRTIADSAD